MEQGEKKVPVTILTGQLGSGKSTLLRRILTEQTQYKIAIVMNEFSQTADIEGKAIQMTVARDGTEVQEWLELENGCLCCSAQDQGVRAIESLMERREKFDYVIIETTGVADPSQIATLFWLDSALESVIYLDGIVTVLDSMNLPKQLREEEDQKSGTVTKQIAVADSLYLSKTDLVDTDSLKKVKHYARELNPSALYSYSYNSLDETLKVILHLDAFSSFQKALNLSTGEADDKSLITDKRLLEDRLEPRVGQLLEENFKFGHQGITSITIPLPILKDVESSESRFDVTFRRMIWEGVLGGIEGGFEVLRAKGILKDSDGRSFILQGVRDMYEIQMIKDVENFDSSQERPKLVLIGTRLDEKIRDEFLKELLT
ncbi:CobW/HypB/UreG, nucleotide-binding domain-containing protein [Phakopsora pachyrhizi]|uniref:CobW/HypB/UreG, nucleotide-binding domain-domain-containing protein n=1 Tax=Phakopsora pachyrhizi TaxID=170000 RepID=A0AAV0AS19_PHAPC|nr:CobW/HypB/UreG, nucleotide-binding domain-containing protein [Phakopsora pachyrhizi]CAH7672216.1 CobW/HypB/UreG, nucleotide-binding domain-domain-containing protein [Phakopsora pachyrhizi]